MFNDTKTGKTKTVLIIFLLMAIAWPAHAAGPRKSVKSGNEMYGQGNYAAAQQKFQEALDKDPESDIINFNLGTALYKEGRYQDVLDHYQKVFLSEDEMLKQKAHYNSGNTYYQMGLKEEAQGNVTSAIPLVENALKQYDRALEIKQDDDDTKHNRDFVGQELKRLKELQQQQQNKQDQQQDSQKQDDQQEPDQSSQDDQSQDQQGRQQQQDQQDRQDQSGQEQKNSDQQGQDQQQQDSGQKQEGEQGSGENSQQNTGQQQQNGPELTEQEAQMMLERYQQAEEPQHPLSLQPQQVSPGRAVNDW